MGRVDHQTYGFGVAVHILVVKINSRRFRHPTVCVFDSFLKFFFFQNIGFSGKAGSRESLFQETLSLFQENVAS